MYQNSRLNRLAARLAAIGLILVLASGCLVGPDFARPAVDMPEAWREFEDENVYPVQDDLGEWWKSFNDPILDVFIEQALAENLDLREALLRITEARCQRGVVNSDLGPQFDTDASYSSRRSTSPGLGSTQVVFPHFRSIRWG